MFRHREGARGCHCYANCHLSDGHFNSFVNYTNWHLTCFVVSRVIVQSEALVLLLCRVKSLSCDITLLYIFGDVVLPTSGSLWTCIIIHTISASMIYCKDIKGNYDNLNKKLVDSIIHAGHSCHAYTLEN